MGTKTFISYALVASPLLAACATDVSARATPAALRIEPEGQVIRLVEGVHPRLLAGRIEPLRAGTCWRAVGTIAEGTVYEPLDSLLQVRTAHAHEAHLVLQDEQIVGLYLPVEKAFLGSRTPTPLKLEICQ